MGSMHDTLKYLQRDPIHRQYHQNDITFSLTYAFSENFLLPLSHDEVVHGKGSLMDRMPGDEWQRFANLRLLYGYMFTHPGTKLLFMGGEIGQTSQWKHDQTIEWYLLAHAPHVGIQSLIRDLNQLYRNEPALYERSFSNEGFQWIEYNDSENCVISYLRIGHRTEATLLVVVNFTPVTREGYRLGAPDSDSWIEIFNTDNEKYWGSGTLNTDTIHTDEEGMHGREKSLSLTLPPLGVSILKQA
jgi:1,4-alpha-glucan branching enzyme